MESEASTHTQRMQVVWHHIYEFKKGLRSLVLCTMCGTCAQMVTERLDKQGIGYLVQREGSRKINLFFGREDCLEAVKSFIHKPLNLLTAEEDFMLGAMLGYDIQQQCRRFCQRKFPTKEILN